MQIVSRGILALAVLAGCAPLAARAQDAGADTRLSTQIFLNASQLDRAGVDSADEGLAVDLKRTFVTLDHRFNQRWSAQITTDMQWNRNSDPTDVWVRHAYLQRSFGQGSWLRLGNAPMPWIAQESAREGFRYVDPGLVARSKMGAPADYGVHGQYRNGDLVYTAAVVTGGGFQKPRLGNRADLEARVGWTPVKGLELAAGGYRGTRAQDAGSRPHEHTAQRWNAMASWVGARGRAGAQYFRAKDWTRIIKPGSDDQRGWSAWSSYQFTPQYGVFARFDEIRMSLDIDPLTRERYHQLGVEWKPNRQLRLAAVGKRVEQESRLKSMRSNEAGVWAQLAF